jgi:transcriptional regulator
MYLPRHFAAPSDAAVRELIESHPFATVVRTSVDPADAPTAEHLPLYWDDDGSAHGRLLGHVARGNGLWQHPPTAPLLAIFHGPQTYISPNWYATKASGGGKVVPTWNYIVAHVTGRLTAIDDPALKRPILQRLTDQHEANEAHPWSVDDAPPEYVETLLNAIVGIEIRIEAMTGKWKVSQNRPRQDRTSVAEALKTSQQRDAAAMREWVEGRYS